MSEFDHYQILGVSRDATDEEIRAAYIKLVKKTHPDANPTGSSAELFQRVQQSYNALKDPEKRKSYDNTVPQENEQGRNYTESSDYMDIADVYHKNGNYEFAIQNYNIAIKLNPYLAIAYFGRGMAYSSIYDFTRAINDYDKTIELGGVQAEVFWSRSLAKLHLGGHEDAASDLRIALSLAKRDGKEDLVARIIDFLGQSQQSSAQRNVDYTSARKFLPRVVFFGLLITLIVLIIMRLDWWSFLVIPATIVGLIFLTGILSGMFGAKASKGHVIHDNAYWVVDVILSIIVALVIALAR